MIKFALLSSITAATTLYTAAGCCSSGEFNMKFLSVHCKRKNTPAAMRDLNPYGDFLSAESSCHSKNCSSRSANRVSAATVRGVEVQRPKTVVDVLYEQQHQELMEAFRIIDKNGNGKISKMELKAMWSNLHVGVTDKELEFMIQEADVDGDGEIDLPEFVTLNRKFGLGLENPDNYSEELQLAFIMADENRDGRISAAELQKLMRRLGKKKITLTESYAMLQCVDSDHDDLINFAEFDKLMSSSIFADPKHSYCEST